MIYVPAFGSFHKAATIWDALTYAASVFGTHVEISSPMNGVGVVADGGSRDVNEARTMKPDVRRVAG